MPTVAIADDFLDAYARIPDDIAQKIAEATK